MLANNKINDFYGSEKRRGKINRQTDDFSFYSDIPIENYDGTDPLSDIFKAKQIALPYVEQLTESQQEVMALLLDGYTNEEVDQILNISESARKMRKKRGVIKLNKLIKDDFGYDY